MDQVLADGSEPTLDSSLEPGTSYPCMHQFDTELETGCFEIIVQFQAVIDDECFRNTIGQVVIGGTEEFFDVDLFQDGVHQAFHHQTVAWRLKADENSNRIACVLIAYSRNDWTANRESVEGIDDEQIESAKIELPALVRSSCPW